MIRSFSGMFRQGIIYCILIILVTSCNLPILSKFSPTNQTNQKTPTTNKPGFITPKPDYPFQKSIPIFQVFILNPIITCIAGNDFYSGNVCYGKNCGDCNCTWEEFDPPAPLTGIPPDQINDEKFKNFDQRLCFETTLSESEISQITQDMFEIHDLVLE